MTYLYVGIGLVVPQNALNLSRICLQPRSVWRVAGYDAGRAAYLAARSTGNLVADRPAPAVSWPATS